MDSYPKNHGTLDDACDTRVRRLEKLLDGLEISDITFHIDDFTVEAAAAIDHPCRRWVIETTPTADNDVSSTVLSHMDG